MNKTKKTKVITTVSDTAKRKLDSSRLTKKNLSQSAKATKAKEAKESIEREVKYNYPADCKSADQRKEFRRKSRQFIRRTENQLSKVSKDATKEGKQKAKELTGSLHEFKSKTLTHAN